MKGITESLAGRVAILDLLGFSEKEKAGQAESQTPFIPTEEWIVAAAKKSTSTTLDAVYRAIWEGSFPLPFCTPGMSRDIFYNSYLQTYIERDVKDILKVGNELQFYNFIRSTAARTGQLLNYADLARDVDIDQKTAKAWLSVLKTSGLVMLLEPYHNNVAKRIVKTPKLYFLDTGLAAFLTGWDSPASLEAGAMNGAFLETHVFVEILKSYWHNGKYPMLTPVTVLEMGKWLSCRQRRAPGPMFFLSARRRSNAWMSFAPGDAVFFTSTGYRVIFCSKMKSISF